MKHEANVTMNLNRHRSWGIGGGRLSHSWVGVWSLLFSRTDIHDIRCLPNTIRKFSEYFMTTYLCSYSHGLKMVPNFESGNDYTHSYGHCCSQGIWVFSGIMLILYCSIQITQWDQISLSLQFWTLICTYEVSNHAESIILKLHHAFSKACNFSGEKCDLFSLFLCAIWKFH